MRTGRQITLPVPCDLVSEGVFEQLFISGRISIKAWLRFLINLPARSFFAP